MDEVLLNVTAALQKMTEVLLAVIVMIQNLAEL